MSQQNRIDVHLLHSPTENQLWLNKCIRSLHNEPVNIHHCQSVPGDIREARARGFACGSAEFVSFVDTDDTVNHGAFNACLKALDDAPHACGAYTTSAIIRDIGGIDTVVGEVHPYRKWGSCAAPNLLEIHQLVVMRRCAVEFIIANEYPNIPKMVPTEVWIYWAMAKHAPWVAVDMQGYNWRWHSENASRLTSAGDADVNRTIELIKSVQCACDRE